MKKKTVSESWYGKPEKKLQTQIVQFTNGQKKTIRFIKRIDEGEMVKITTSSYHEFLIPKDKILWVERYYED